MSQKKEECKAEEAPYCGCGKCVIRRLRKNPFTSFPYAKDLGSTYTKDFAGKSQIKLPELYNKSKHNGFEGIYRENLPTSLMSTQKFDYKPFKVQQQEIKEEEHIIDSMPFFGRTSYQTQYPNWGGYNPGGKPSVEFTKIEIPLRGKSNYNENYTRFPPKNYKTNKALNFSKDTLEFYGRFNGETCSGSTFKPVDFNQAHYFSKEKFRKIDIEKCNIIPAPVSKVIFSTTYGENFYDRSSKTNCDLRNYLVKDHKKHLDI
jgi:hypothetical protein